MNDSLKKQVTADHYAFERYVSPERWMSYYHQLSEIFALKDFHSILEIGPGTTLMRDVLTYHRPDVHYRSLDMAEDVHPDILGSATDIPLESDTVDVVCAFQILEHLPFEHFEKALSEIARVSKKNALISLPHYGSHVRFECKIPMLPHIRFAWKFPSLISHAFDGQHYWEVGKKGSSKEQVRKKIEKHFQIKKEYTPYENQSHRFYILIKQFNRV